MELVTAVSVQESDPSSATRRYETPFHVNMFVLIGSELIPFGPTMHF